MTTVWWQQARAVASFALGLMVLAPPAARANGASYGGVGDQVYAIPNDRISMRKEIVRLDLTGALTWRPVHVRCEFWFRNDGDSTTIQMGFPVHQPDYGFTADSLQFRVLLDGISLGTRAARDMGGPWPDVGPDLGIEPRIAFLWPVHFDAGQERRIVVTYNLQWSGMDGVLYGSYTGYILRTGALWKDPIGECDIWLDLPRGTPLLALRLAPGGFSYEGDSVRWHYVNVRPNADIDVRLAPGLVERYRGRFQAPFHDRGDDYRWNHELTQIEGGEFWMDSMGNESPTFPHVREALLGASELARNVRNEIYARHGYRFTSPDLQTRFAACAWYRPDPAFTEKAFSPIERLNLTICREWEAAVRQIDDPKRMWRGIKAAQRRTG